MAELNRRTKITGNSLLDNLSSGLFNIGDLLDSGAAATGKALGLPQDTSSTVSPAYMGKAVNPNIGRNQIVSAGPKEVTSELPLLI